MRMMPRFLMLLLALVVVGARPDGVHAQSDGDQTPVTIVAPIDATSCSATPPTITVLGQTIDVSGAAISGADDSSGCAALVVGDTAAVQLAGSGAPLAATAVGRPPCPFLVPFCPAECHLDHRCPARCHCPGPGTP
jgi:hypothetical protein